jgi:hypothetical protein
MGIYLVLGLIFTGFLMNCQTQAPPPPPPPPVEPQRESLPEIPSLRPLTKKILDRAYNRDHLDVKEFQYFLSGTIEMERGRNNSTLSHNTKGEVFQEDSLTHERIVIEKETMGVAVDIRVSKDYEHWEVDIRFEPANNRTLTFIENDEGTSFDLFYVETRTGDKIPYGTEEYDLSFAEIPCLLIKLIETENDVSVVTNVEGIAVDSFSSRVDP